MIFSDEYTAFNVVYSKDFSLLKITGSIKNYGGNTGMVIKYTSATQVTINLSVGAIAWYETSYFTSGRIRLILY